MGELTRLGRYELRRVLGKGAMGVVYEGFDPSLNRSVAIKTILKSIVTDEETAAAYSARFAREAKAAGRLSHPHIVQVYDFGEENDVAYLAMEYIQGRELRACFEARERFDADQTVRIMGELLDALDFAHQAGVIHRDVKPANIMLDDQRRVKLADFGVARLQDGSERSKSGAMVGTPAFMSPEQVSGGRMDRRTDVFSAGIVLYQLLTNELPFKGEGAWTVAKQIMQDEPPRPSTVVRKIAPAFDRIVSTALAKNPEHRFSSAKEFLEALRGALAGDRTAAAQHGSGAEVEFWRTIQSSNDPAEFEVYLKGFPDGTYADLARLKIAKLPRLAAGEMIRPAAHASQPPSQRSVEVEKLAEETAKLEVEIAKREAEFRKRETEHRKREAEAEAKRLAEEKARAEAEARRQAEEKERKAAEDGARLAAMEKARRDAEAEADRREAEYRGREAVAVAKAETEAKARLEAEARAKREVEARTKAEAEARAKAQAEAEARATAQAEAAERAKKQAEALARQQAEIVRREADLEKRVAQASRGKSPLIPATIAFLIIAAVAFGGWYWSTSSDEARLEALVAALDAATKATQDLNLARQRQDELRKQVDVARLAEDDARAKGDQTKLKELQELTKKAEAEAQKQNELVKQREAEAKKTEDAAKVADVRKQTDTAKAAEKAAQEKAAQEKAAQEKAEAERLAAEKAATEKIAAEKAAAEKVAAEKVAAAKAAAAKAAATAKPSWPNVGDRWVYDVQQGPPDVKYQATVEVLAVTAISVQEVFRPAGGSPVTSTLRAGARMTGIAPGIAIFAPYLRAFQELRVGENWSGIEIQQVGPCMHPQSDCSASASVAGKERVTVRAGSFDAWRIVVSARGTHPPTNRAVIAEYTYWYSEDVKRIVKYQVRGNTHWSDPNCSMELVSYTPAGPK